MDELDRGAIGRFSNSAATTSYFDGEIDEVQLYTRPLSSAEIEQLYYGSLYGGNVMNSSRLSVHDNWTLGVRACDYLNCSTETNSSNQTVKNALPTVTSVIVNSSIQLNRSHENITCWTTIADVDGDSVFANYTWFVDGAKNESGQSSSLTVGTLTLVANISSTNTTRGQNWTCSIQAFDGVGYSTALVNSTNLTILNTPPVISPIILNITENQSDKWYFEANATDNDVTDGVENLTWAGNDTIVDVNATNGNITDTPGENETNNYSINISVTDGTNKTWQIFNYSVRDNKVPKLNNFSLNVSIGTSGDIFKITVNVTDGHKIGTVFAYVQKPDENNSDVINLTLNSDGLYNGTWNSSDRGDGTYVIDIAVNDSSLNENETENVGVIALSSSAVGTYSNFSIDLVADTVTIINATNETGVDLNLTVNTSLTGSLIIAKYDDNILESSCATIATEIGVYVDVSVDNHTNKNLTTALMAVHYSDDLITTANVDESTLTLRKCNVSSGSWELVSGAAVDVENNFVRGTMGNFSMFGIFGTAKVAAGGDAPAVGGGSGGGGGGTATSPRWTCDAEYDCSSWSSCLPSNVMTRSCVRLDSCEGPYRSPIEVRDCVYKKTVEEIVPVVEKLAPVEKEVVVSKNIVKDTFVEKVIPTVKKSYDWTRLYVKALPENMLLIVIGFIGLVAFGLGLLLFISRLKPGLILDNTKEGKFRIGKKQIWKGIKILGTILGIIIFMGIAVLGVYFSIEDGLFEARHAVKAELLGPEEVIGKVPLIGGILIITFIGLIRLRDMKKGDDRGRDRKLKRQIRAQAQAQIYQKARKELHNQMKRR